MLITRTPCSRCAHAENDFSIDQLVKNAKQLVANWLERTPGDPNIEDLQRALGPPPPDGYLSVLLSVEDVIVRREWDVSSLHLHARALTYCYTLHGRMQTVT